MKRIPTCLKPLYMMRISCLVNLVCRHRSSRATGLGCGNADVLFSCSSSSISVASSMIGLSGGVAISRWPPNRSPPVLPRSLSPQLLLQPVVLPVAGSSLAIGTRTGRPTTTMVLPGEPVVPARHRPRRERPPDRSAATARRFRRTFRCYSTASESPGKR